MYARSVICMTPPYAISCKSSHLIHLERTKDGEVEPERGEESDGSRHEEKSQAGQSHVPKVEEVGSERVGPECLEVDDAVQEDVDGGAAGGAEGPPPPVIVLVAELEVGEEEGDLGARDDEDDEDDEQEPEDVVVVLIPDGGHDKVELDEAGAEGEDAADHHGERSTHEPRLVRNLAWDVGGLDREFDDLRLVTEEGTGEDERDGDSEPHDDEDEHGGEGHGIRGSHRPCHDVHGEEEEEGETWEAEGGGQGGTLPGLALEVLVETSRDVTVDETHEDEEEKLRHEERTALCWAEEAHGGEDDGPEGHA
mmetsp:Transcript_10320/g.28390  ORF Transcript_10320/g.28390 Transcript_10320/m.28390 type:complete len:309 (+) Transcript_10320:272-1198(+)